MSGIRTILTCLKHPFNLNVPTIKRSYSVYPPNYVEPIFRHEHQRELTKEQLKELQHVPIKPAKKTDTSSEFFDETVRKLINYIMRDGKKVKARELVDNTFTLIKRKQIKRYHEADDDEKKDIMLDPKMVFHQAVINCTPMLELVKMYRGGIAYKIPTPLSANRARFLTMKWFIQVGKEHDRKTSSFSQALANELIQASEFSGQVIVRKQELHKQCEANRAYAHYRWIKQKK